MTPGYGQAKLWAQLCLLILLVLSSGPLSRDYCLVPLRPLDYSPVLRAWHTVGAQYGFAELLNLLLTRSPS